MACRTTALALCAAVTLGYAGVGAAADESLGKDLGATIALQGKPCDKVVDAKRNGDSDYIATCKDGNRYHVFVDSNGRVVVQKI
ncbi:MAG TPA: hypothetical protein VHB68_05835 [Steroidobacteraceae bacterium]|nr:hypothetical protein [Steroidobacteraceae bacterium]